jgi:cysteine/O-acetylserine efflux protein
MGLLYGYKNTVIYQAGLAVGVLFLRILSSWFSAALLKLFPALEPIMRYAGAGYILYLAYGTLKTSYAYTEKNVKSLGFTHGFLLQVLNPKLYVYAFTLFSSFLSSMKVNTAILVLVCILLAAVSFCATSMWAAFGTAIKTYLHNPRLKTILNILLSLLLVYTAITLIGVIP